jgi:hypothetical protein
MGNPLNCSTKFKLSIPGFCFILPITLKSEFWVFLIKFELIGFRILISCIKFLAKCMCPRCLSVKSKITEVGSKMDMRNRVKHARTDDDARRFDVEEVRKMLFEKGINISSVKIDWVLGPTSAVPTRVRILLI